MRNYYEFVEELFGASLRHSNRGFIESLTVNDLAAVRERYHDGWHRFQEVVRTYYPVYPPPPPPSVAELVAAPMPYRNENPDIGEFAPLLHGRIHQCAEVFGGDQLGPWETANLNDQLLVLKRYLLYCHRVTIADPLWYLFQFVPFNHPDDEFAAKTRTAVTNYLDFLYSVRPLVTGGILRFYPQYEHTGVGFSKRIFEDEEFAEWAAAHSPEEWRRNWGNVRYTFVLEVLFYCIRHHASCALDRPDLEPWLKLALQYGNRLAGLNVASNDIRLRDARVVSRITSVRLPGLSALSFPDIVAVRKNSDGFERWREGLRDGLLRLEDETTLGAPLVVPAVAESLAQGLRSLHADIRNSSVLSSVKEQATTLTIGAVAGALAGQPLGGLAAGVATAALSVLAHLAKERSAHAAQRSLMRHYSVWYPESDNTTTA